MKMRLECARRPRWVLPKLAAAVAPQAQCIAVVPGRCTEGQKVLRPAPGAVEGAVQEEQRRLRRVGCRCCGRCCGRCCRRHNEHLQARAVAQMVPLRFNSAQDRADRASEGGALGFCQLAMAHRLPAHPAALPSVQTFECKPRNTVCKRSGAQQGSTAIGGGLRRAQRRWMVVPIWFALEPDSSVLRVWQMSVKGTDSPWRSGPTWHRPCQVETSALATAILSKPVYDLACLHIGAAYKAGHSFNQRR